jgi:hypothetical protein
MNQQLTTTNDDFNQWLIAEGYLSESGELSVGLREAEAYWRLSLIEEDKTEIERRFIRIAKNLWAVFSKADWIPLGLDNYTQYLKMPEVDIAISVGYDLKDVGRYLESGVFSEEQLAEIGASKARAMLPAIRANSEDVEELLEKASVLNVLDLTDEIMGRDVSYYRGHGPLPELIKELEGRPEFWEGDVTLTAKTC